jgi:hypothetical protein
MLGSDRVLVRVVVRYKFVPYKIEGCWGCWNAIAPPPTCRARARRAVQMPRSGERAREELYTVNSSPLVGSLGMRNAIAFSEVAAIAHLPIVNPSQ